MTHARLQRCTFALQQGFEKLQVRGRWVGGWKFRPGHKASQSVGGWIHRNEIGSTRPKRGKRDKPVHWSNGEQGCRATAQPVSWRAEDGPGCKACVRVGPRGGPEGPGGHGLDMCRCAACLPRLAAVHQKPITNDDAYRPPPLTSQADLEPLTRQAKLLAKQAAREQAAAAVAAATAAAAGAGAAAAALKAGQGQGQGPAGAQERRGQGGVGTAAGPGPGSAASAASGRGGGGGPLPTPNGAVDAASGLQYTVQPYAATVDLESPSLGTLRAPLAAPLPEVMAAAAAATSTGGGGGVPVRRHLTDADRARWNKLDRILSHQFSSLQRCAGGGGDSRHDRLEEGSEKGSFTGMGWGTPLHSPTTLCTPRTPPPPLQTSPHRIKYTALPPEYMQRLYGMPPPQPAAAAQAPTPAAAAAAPAGGM